MNSSTAFRVAAFFGLLAVALGAFGAHALKDLLLAKNMTGVWEKAVLYHGLHAVVLLVLAGRQPLPVLAWMLFGAGILIFSGSLYVLALTGLRWVGAITPLGGLSLLAGWATLVWKG